MCYINFTYSNNLLRQTTYIEPQNQYLISDVLLIRIGLLYVNYLCYTLLLCCCGRLQSIKTSRVNSSIDPYEKKKGLFILSNFLVMQHSYRIALRIQIASFLGNTLYSSLIHLNRRHHSIKNRVDIYIRIYMYIM